MVSPSLAQLANPRSLAQQSRDLLGDSVRWLSSHTLEILIGLGAGALIVAMLYAARLIGMRLCRGSDDRLSWRTVGGRVLAKTSLWFMVAAAAELVTGYAGAPGSLRTTTHFLFVVAATLQAAIWVRELVMGAIEHRAGGGDPQGALGSALGILRLLVSVGVFGVATLTILSNLDVDVTGLVAGLGVGGIAIGLAAQGIFADLFAAVSILFDKPFRRGDVIKWDESIGTVESIGLKSTRVRATTGEEVIISNTNLLDKELHNFKRLSYRRTTVLIGLTYESPRDKLSAVPAVLRTLVEAEPDCRFVRCGLQNFGDSSLDFELQYDVESELFDVVFNTRHRINMAILERFAADNLGFAYPTQVSYAANPDGTLVAPYPDMQKIDAVDGDEAARSAAGGRVSRFLSRG